MRDFAIYTLAAIFKWGILFLVPIYSIHIVLQTPTAWFVAAIIVAGFAVIGAYVSAYWLEQWVLRFFGIEEANEPTT